jgi:hypothetical protein
MALHDPSQVAAPVKNRDNAPCYVAGALRARRRPARAGAIDADASHGRRVCALLRRAMSSRSAVHAAVRTADPAYGEP